LNGSDSVETPVLTLGATGEGRQKNLYEPSREFSFADLKGDLDSIGALAGSFEWHEGGPAWLHPARRGRLQLRSNEIGAAGQLARQVAEKFKFRQDVFLAEFDLDRFCSAVRAAKEARRYEPLPRFPGVERDFSLLLPDGTHFSSVVNAIQALNISEISGIEAADLFRGKNVPAGKYSLLVRITFQSREATLTDAQIGDYSARIVASLENNLGAQLRAQ